MSSNDESFLRFIFYSALTIGHLRLFTDRSDFDSVQVNRLLLARNGKAQVQNLSLSRPVAQLIHVIRRRMKTVGTFESIAGQPF